VEPSPELAEEAELVARGQRLNPDDTQRLVMGAAALADGLRWEAADGFTLTESVRGTIAAHAALLGLGLEPDSYREVSSVIVHATMIERGGEHVIGGGVVSDGTMTLAGEAHPRGPILLSWDSVVADVGAPWRGRNVILHEFAHHLDMLDGWIDGTPVITDSPTRQRWVDTCTDAYERLRSRDGWGVLDPYGATDPAEFFAVAIEAFFTRPVELREHEPALYQVLADYLGQDPADR